MMRLAHLQQQVAELPDFKVVVADNIDFSRQVVILHSQISAVASNLKNGNDLGYGLAAILVNVVGFPAMFSGWGDIWGTQALDDFSPDLSLRDNWKLLYKLHQLASGLVGGRSDIILLYKMVQVVRALADKLGGDLEAGLEKFLANQNN
jgi:hypothetical protein